MSRAKDDGKRNERMTYHRLRHVTCPKCGALGGGHFMPPSLGEPGRFVCEVVNPISDRPEIARYLRAGQVRAAMTAAEHQSRSETKGGTS